jgi:hypothetical protein
MNSATKKGHINNTINKRNLFLSGKDSDIKAFSIIANNIDAIPCILNTLIGIQKSVILLQNEMQMRDSSIKGDDCWMDAEDARRYMQVSKNTFNSYRYNFNPRLVGSPVGGKTFYKKSDIDHWVRTFQYKSADLSS